MSDTVFHITVSELYTAEHINQEVITAAVEYGIARPVSGKSVNDWVFHTNDAHWLKKAARLCRDLEIDWLAASVVIDLLKKNAELERENARLHTRLQRFS